MNKEKEKEIKEKIKIELRNYVVDLEKLSGRKVSIVWTDIFVDNLFKIIKN